jgi:hypothetical protein
MKIKIVFLSGLLAFFCVGVLFSQSPAKNEKALGGKQAIGYISYEDCMKDEACRAAMRAENKGRFSTIGGLKLLSPKTYPRLYKKYKNNLFVIGGFILFFLILALWIYGKSTRTPL